MCRSYYSHLGGSLSLLVVRQLRLVSSREEFTHLRRRTARYTKAIHGGCVIRMKVAGASQVQW